jgi:RNA polymerase sigma-70 factor (ECF subfamily)
MSQTTQHDGDDERVTAWVREHGAAIRGFVWGMVRRSDVVDDLVQDVFFRAWQARHRYAESGSVRAYLLRIADRLVCDHSRKAGREISVEDDDWQRIEPVSAGPLPSDTLSLAETGRQLTAALDELSSAQRRVLLLRYYGNLEFAEIARAMDCPLGTVLSHCRRGLLALRKVLAGETMGAGDSRAVEGAETQV